VIKKKKKKKSTQSPQFLLFLNQESSLEMLCEARFLERISH